MEIADGGTWNDFVSQFPAYDLKQGFEWGALREEAGWQPHRLAVFDEERCVAATGVLVRPIPRVGAMLYAPRGPLFHPTRLDALAALVAAVREMARGTGGILLRASPGVPVDDTATIEALQRCGFRPLPEEFTTWNTPRCTQPLDLRASEEALWHAVRRRFREYVKASRRKGLTIEETDGEQDLDAFYGLLVNAARMKGFPIRGRSYFRSLFRRYRAAGTLTLLLARAHDTLLGGLLAVRLARRSFVLYISARSEDETLKHHVSPALYWEHIRRAKAQGCERADFGPSGVHLTPRETDNGYGVYRFKTGFGCGLETYAPFHDLVFRPALYRALRLSETFVLPRLWGIGARATPALRRMLTVGRTADVA